MCMNYHDHCPISSQRAHESEPVASPDLSIHWLVAHPIVTRHYYKVVYFEKSYLTFIIIR
jgi:hypothetical protein